MPEYHLECPDNCTFKEGKPWSQQATEGILGGTSFRTLVAQGGKAGVKFSLMALSRHKKHIVVSGQEPETALPKATNIEILEKIIQTGFANSKNWKPTISDTMKAMDMWFRLTQGNPFDELLDTLASASLEGDEPEEANSAAVSLPDELEDVIDPEG
jgi:hypothetical protein